nr:skin secretory protein xP2-like [Aegilops tauschii subsp. strangulata]
MPCFCEWGQLPEGHEGPCDNHLLVTPVLAGPAVHAPEVTAGERALPSAHEVAAGEQAPPRAPKVAAGEQVPPCPPEVAAPSPSGDGGGAPPTDAAAVPTVEGYAPAPSASLPDLGASWKRKGLRSRRNLVPLTLKGGSG